MSDALGESYPHWSLTNEIVDFYKEFLQENK